MKTHLILGTLLSIAAITVAWAADHEGTGTRGGGKAFYDGEHFELPDLVDPTACDTVTGGDLIDDTLDGLDIESVTQLKPILSRIEALDWYFALDLERQIRGLSFCFTRFLKPYITEDDPRFRRMTPVYFKDQVQAGVRDGNSVFVERDVYHGMTPDTRAFFIIHETMHSYVNMDDRLHNTHVKTMVKALHNVNTGDIRTRHLLHSAMSINAIQFPQTVDQLDSGRDFLTYLFESEKARRERVLNGASLTPILYPPRYPEISLLLPEDANVLETAERDVVDTTLGGFCETVDRPVISRVVQDPALVSIDYATACLSKLGSRVTPSDFAFLTRLANHSQNIDELFNQLAAKRAEIRNHRIMVPVALAWLSRSGADSRRFLPAGELRPLEARQLRDASSYATAFSEAIALVAQNGQVDQAIEMTAGDPRFLAAFSIVPLLAQIDLLNPPIARDKQVAKDALVNLFTAYWAETLRRVRERDGDDVAQRLAASIDTLQLGYPVAVPVDEDEQNNPN